MYNGQDGKIVFTRQCASYFGNTNACFDFDGGTVVATDCCNTNDVTPTTVYEDPINPEFCTASMCNAGEGPCIFSYTEDTSQGENICIAYMLPATETRSGTCYPNAARCTDVMTAETTSNKVTTTKPEETTTITEDTGNHNKDDIYFEYCDNCFGETQGPCRSDNVVPNTNGQYVCLPYLPIPAER